MRSPREAGDEGPQALLSRARGLCRDDAADLPVAGDQGSVDGVGLLQKAHRFGEAADVAGIDQAAGPAGLPEQDKGDSLEAAARLHDDEPDAMGFAERRELCDAGRVVAEAARGSTRLDMRVEPLLGHIHSTDDLVHGNLPCACGWDRATIRSYVTEAMIPSSPTVVAGGGTGDIATLRVGWPPNPKRRRFHRTNSTSCRYKGAV